MVPAARYVPESTALLSAQFVSEICAAADGRTAAPTERVMFPAGRFSTTKGEFLFDEEAQRLVMEDWTRWTGGLPQKGTGDYEHDQANPNMPGHLKLDSCSYDLQIKGGQLVAVNIQWTERASEMIGNREKRFTSPWFFYDRETRRIVRFINFGLVSMPATIAQEPLVASLAASHLDAGYLGAAVNYCTYLFKYMIGLSVEHLMCCLEAMDGDADMAARAGCAEMAAKLSEAIGTYAKCMGQAEEQSATESKLSDVVVARIAKLGEADRKPVTEALQRAAQLGLPLGEIHAAALKLAGAKELGAETLAALQSAQAARPLIETATKIAGETDPEKASAALLALDRDVPEFKAAREAAEERMKLAEEAKLAADKQAAEAQVAREKAEKEKAEAEAKAEKLAYDKLFAEGKAAKKINGPDEESWVRENVKTSVALSGFLAKKKPAHIGKNFTPPTTTTNVAAGAMTEAEIKATIEAVELDAKEMAGWQQTGGGEQRLFNHKKAKAQRLGLIPA